MMVIAYNPFGQIKTQLAAVVSGHFGPIMAHGNGSSKSLHTNHGIECSLTIMDSNIHYCQLIIPQVFQNNPLQIVLLELQFCFLPNHLGFLEISFLSLPSSR